MLLNATSRLVLVAGLVGALGLSSSVAFGQTEPLGDEFIFFVNGSNLVVPSFGGNTVEDPTDPSNTVAEFPYGGWAANGWRWSSGIDMTANIGENVGEGDTLYLRIWSDPANAGLRADGVFRLSFFDVADESAEVYQERDFEFRAAWHIPQWVHDGQWHDLDIPLPPSTRPVLDSARVGKKVDGSPLDAPLDTLAQYWMYGGAWGGSLSGTGHLGTAQDPSRGSQEPDICLAPNPNDPLAVWESPCEDELWKEFSWDSVSYFGVHYENASGGGTIYLDDVYIGGPNTSTEAANDPASPVASASASADGAVNVITWAASGDASAYNIYYSDEPITSLPKAGGGLALGATVEATADPLELRHELQVPHPSIAAGAIHYAVTSLSGFGVENKDISNSTTSIANPDLAVQPLIPILTEGEADAIFADISAGTVTDANFPEASGKFIVDENNWSPGDAGGDTFNGNADLSFWARFGIADVPGSGAEMFFYAEVTDDANAFPAETVPGGEVWNYDSIQINWGSYEVPWITGSDQNPMQRGAKPDYQWSAAVYSSDPATGTISQNFAQGNGLVFSSGIDANIDGGLFIADNLDMGAGTVGYKVLAYFPMASIINLNATPVDALFEAPAADAFKIVPLNISVNDNDTPGGGNARDDQKGWSDVAGCCGGGWNNPTVWKPVAVAGRATLVAVDEIGGEVPAEYTLEQNYPNPFNPETTINFSLPSSEKVSLTVFDMLGREVSTLIDGQTMAAGRYAVRFDAAQRLASGVYVYRLDAGEAFSRTMTMILVK